MWNFLYVCPCVRVHAEATGQPEVEFVSSADTPQEHCPPRFFETGSLTVQSLPGRLGWLVHEAQGLSCPPPESSEYKQATEPSFLVWVLWRKAGLPAYKAGISLT